MKGATMDRETQSIGAVEVCILGGRALSAAAWASAQLAAFLGGGEFLDLSSASVMPSAPSCSCLPIPANRSLPGRRRSEAGYRVRPCTGWRRRSWSPLWRRSSLWSSASLVVGGRRLTGGAASGVPATGRIARPSDLRSLIVRRPEPGRFLLGRVGRRTVATERATAPARRRSPARGQGSGGTHRAHALGQDDGSHRWHPRLGGTGSAVLGQVRSARCNRPVASVRRCGPGV